MIQLLTPSPEGWVDLALRDFDHFLVDHAACERKASATGMMFVVRYPDKIELVESMVQFAREELMHFHQVFRLITKRNLRLGGDDKNFYINGLLKQEKQQANDYCLLDRLLIFGIVEARGQERFALIGKHHTDPKIADFYTTLAEAESRHNELFCRLAKVYFDSKIVDQRLGELLQIEAEILRSLPLRPCVH